MGNGSEDGSLPHRCLPCLMTDTMSESDFGINTSSND